MATKNYVDLSGITRYDQLIKNYIDTEDAKSIKSLSVSGNTVSFFKTNDATGTAAYTVNMPDVSGFMSKIASAQGGKIVTSVSGGEVAESNTAISDLATNAFVGTIPGTATATTVTGYIDEAVATAVSALDTASDIGIASKSGNAVTISGSVKEQDGIIAKGTATDITLADVASTGAAANVSITDFDGNFTSTDVEGALAELAEASAGGVASKTVYLVDETSGQSAYAKVYTFYQGSDSSDMTNNTNLGSINIAKDKVVSGGAVVDITYNSGDGKLYDDSTDVTALIKGTGTASASDAGKYIKLELQNVTDPLYIAAKDLVDIYTAQANASQIQLVIDNNNVISASIVAGSVDTTELANSAVTTAKIADDAVTADKVSISAHTESQTAGADGIAISVTTIDGQVSAVSGSIAANTYDAYGSASSALSTAEGYTDSAIAALDADLDASGTAQHSGTFVVSGVTEVDGVLTAVDSVEVETAGAAATAKSEVIGTASDTSTASTIYGAKAYADAATASVPVSSIEALFASAGD